MAKYEKLVHGDFDQLIERIDRAIMNNSSSASFEDSSRYSAGSFRCETRVYERFSWMGGNRVSMAVTLVGTENSYHLSIITSGGSQAMFFKINTIGEEEFLNSIIQEVEAM